MVLGYFILGFGLLLIFLLVVWQHGCTKKVILLGCLKSNDTWRGGGVGGDGLFLPIMIPPYDCFS